MPFSMKCRLLMFYLLAFFFGLNANITTASLGLQSFYNDSNLGNININDTILVSRGNAMKFLFWQKIA